MYLINTHNGIKSKNIPPVDINEYPAIKKHLDKYWDKISKRDDKGDTPYNLRNCIYTDLFLEQNIVWQRITHQNTFCLSDKGFCILDSMAFINCDETYKYLLLAVLNSSLMYFYFKKVTTNYGEAGFRLSNQFVEMTPVPNHISNELNKFVKIVLSNADNQLIKEIDLIVSELYNLSKYEKEYIIKNYK